MSSDQSRKRMVKLCQCLDMDRKTGAPVMGDWVQDKPGQRSFYNEIHIFDKEVPPSLLWL